MTRKNSPKAVSIAALLGTALVLALPGAAGAAPRRAQTMSRAMSRDPASALAAAKAALAAIGNHDAAGFTAIVLPEAILFAQDYGPDGKLRSHVVPRAKLAALIADKSHQLAEKMFDPVVQVEGDLAHVWTPYTFNIDGKRSHCGIDSFGLARIEGVWRVTSLTWTNDPKSCAKWGK